MMNSYVLYVFCYVACIGVWGLVCKESEVRAQRRGVPVQSNGCSKPSFLTVEGEEDFTYCCDRHDACFAMCGASQDFCDKDFKKCMRNLCSTAFPRSKQCPSAADTYALGTSMFGGEAFVQAQEEHCECIAQHRVLDHYKSLASEFYETYSPVNKDKAETALLSETYTRNSGTEQAPIYKDIHKLWYDLHKKYDSAIEHVGQRLLKTNVPHPVKKRKEL
jgi:hypothetical protein